MTVSTQTKIKLARQVAIIAAGFALVMAVLLIANFVQTKLNNPIENKTIPALVKRLSENPADESLKAEIRAFDLMFLGVIISILAIRYILSAKSKLNEIDRANEAKGLDKLVAQKWVIYVGSGLIVVALASGFLASNSLKDYMVNENIVAQEEQPAEQTATANAEQASAPAGQTAQSATPATSENVAAANPSEATEAPVSETAAAKPAGLPTMAELKANYPFFRGPQGNGVAFQKNTPTDWNGSGGKNVIWKVKVPKSGFSSPIIWGNQLFVTGADAQSRMVFCYDKNTGKLLWEAVADNIQGSPSGMPKVTADTGLAAPTMILSLFKLKSLAILAIRQRQKSKKQVANPIVPENHKVSIIVPGYNEEITAPKTVENLLRSDYPNMEIVFVDDGSNDNTFKNIEALYGNHPKVKVLTKPNGGKASALNYGIGFASGDILVCIDADTVLNPDAVSRMVAYFDDPEVAAVAGNVKVGNRKNLLTRWQSIEYITSQNFDRRAYDALNAIMVVPGAIGTFRRDAVQKVGLFTTDTLAEDCDLTLRLLNAGYRVRTCNEALAFTEVPETLHMLLKQRFRWTFGIMGSVILQIILELPLVCNEG